MSKTLYVAETDENGTIACVWVAADGKRVVRPFDPRRHVFDRAQRADFVGARPSAIGSWMAARQLGDT